MIGAWGQIEVLAIGPIHLRMKEEIGILISAGVAARRQRIKPNQTLSSAFVLSPLELPFFPIAPVGHRQAVIFGEWFFLRIFQYPFYTVGDHQGSHAR